MTATKKWELVTDKFFFDRGILNTLSYTLYSWRYGTQNLEVRTGLRQFIREDGGPLVNMLHEHLMPTYGKSVQHTRTIVPQGIGNTLIPMNRWDEEIEKFK